jgi:diguanylate cyclase (GGDEF)-like protein
MLEATHLIYLLLAGAIGFLAGAWLQYRRMAHFRKLAYADVLGIGNQREFREQLQALFAQLKPANENQFVLCILDLDQFKAMNEQFGYTRADAILEQLIDIVNSYIRRSDMIFRYKQGDEFALLFRDLKLEQALEVGNRLRRIIAAYPFLVEDQQVSLTVSMGMVMPISGESMDEFLKRADEALMEAKETKNALVGITL